MGRGANKISRAEQILRDDPDLLELGRRVVADVLEALVDTCESTFPRGASLRVIDRKGKRRILRGEEDVTKVASQAFNVVMPQEQKHDLWQSEPRELVRLIAVIVWGAGDALQYAGE
jgi:hypothetical protein